MTTSEMASLYQLRYSRAYVRHLSLMAAVMAGEVTVAQACAALGCTGEQWQQSWRNAVACGVAVVKAAQGTHRPTSGEVVNSKNSPESRAISVMEEAKMGQVVDHARAWEDEGDGTDTSV